MPMTPAPRTDYHAPVLVLEVVKLLRHAKSVLDGTLGGGGHTAALLDAGVPHVTGIDRDPEAIAAARARLEPFEREGRFHAVLGNFGDVATLEQLPRASFDAALLDLGISSRHIDVAERGFTFRQGAPLDMRMSGESPEAAGGPGVDARQTAADVLNTWDERRLENLFREYGDEPRAARLAREILRRRTNAPFTTSDDLVRAIRGALGPRSGPPDFARLFQALRIAVNDEIEGLRRALPLLRDRLEPGGLLAVIAYHSGEDRVVKHAFRDWSTECTCPPKQPTCTCRAFAYGTTVTRRPVLPRQAEIADNPRARSAKLRAWRRRAG